MADLDSKFRAAVAVIQGLPPDGSFQPSNEMKLKFYGLYKQARQGECNEPRPGFWDLIARYGSKRKVVFNGHLFQAKV